MTAEPPTATETLNFPLSTLHTRDNQHFKAGYYTSPTRMHSHSTAKETNLFPRAQHLLEAKDAWLITEMICEYSKRSLGKENDVLNGLRGVLGTQKEMRHLFGVPVIGRAPMPRDHGRNSQRSRRRIYDAIKWSPLVGLCLGLCWQVERPQARREGFPSWSWAGWKVEDGAGGWVSGPLRWLFSEHTWRSLQGAVDLQLRMKLRDDGRLMEWEDFERQYEALNERVDGMLHLSAWAIRGRVVGVGCNGECTVYLDGGERAWHRWTFPLTDGGFEGRAGTACLAIPLAKTVEGLSDTPVLLVAETQLGVYQRIGADTWHYWMFGATPPTQETWHEFQLE